jgi:hypothetical protein
MFLYINPFILYVHRLTQATVSQQREEALALKEMIRSSHTTPRNADDLQNSAGGGSSTLGASGSSSSFSKLPDMPEDNALYEPDNTDGTSNKKLEMNMISKESLSRKLVKKPATDPAADATIAATAAVDPTIGIAATTTTTNAPVADRRDSTLLKEYFEQRIDAVDHTPLVSARRGLNERLSDKVNNTDSSRTKLEKIISPITSAR